jgi:hypothetical protein
MDQDDELPEEPVVLYVDTDCGNEATAEQSLDDLAESLGHVSWRELLEECLHESVDSHKDNLEEWLEDYYGITPQDLDKRIPSAMINHYYTQLCHRQDNMTGSNVKAFDLIRSLNLIPTDDEGSGSLNGVTLERTTANGPRKSVYIENRESARWLVEQAAERGVELTVRFV